MHGIRKITECGTCAYFESEHGIKAVAHNGAWSGYYRLGDPEPHWTLILTAYCQGKAPPILTSSIRAYEDLAKVYNVLSWDYRGDGEWDACSAINDDGSSFIYRVNVRDDGMFTTIETDSELIGKTAEYFHSLASAKAWCEHNEKQMVVRMKKEANA